MQDSRSDPIFWEQLVLKTQDVQIEGLPQIVERAWKRLTGTLEQHCPVQISDPSDTPWFHVRRRCHFREGGRGAVERIEIIRLRTQEERSGLRNSVLDTALRIGGVAKAEWHAVSFKPRHDDVFLAFLQKLSVLRVVEGIAAPGNLARIEGPYETCRFCREAYDVMTRVESPWYSDLAPWFDYMQEQAMPKSMTHEYAHWFGHILSRW